MRQDFLIEIKDDLNTTFIARKGKHVQYQTGSQTSLALSNLVGERAVTLMWELESVNSGDAALRAVNKVLDAKWINNKPMQPKVRLVEVRKPL